MTRHQLDTRTIGRRLIRGRTVSISPEAPGAAGRLGGLAAVKRVNRTTATVIRYYDDAELRIELDYLDVDGEHMDGTAAQQYPAEFAGELPEELPTQLPADWRVHGRQRLDGTEEPIYPDVAPIEEEQLALDLDEPAPIVIVPCGAAKLDRPAPAAELYTGPLFRSAYLAAQALQAGRGDEVLILSAKHGLVRPGELLEPYNVRLGDPGTIELADLVAQAELHGLDRPVTVLGGSDYVELARHAWPHADAPLADCAGIGYMRGRLAEIRKTAQVPAPAGR